MHRVITGSLAAAMTLLAGVFAVASDPATSTALPQAAPAPVATPPPLPMPQLNGPYRLHVLVSGPPDTKIVLDRDGVGVPLSLDVLGTLDVSTEVNVPLNQAHVKVAATSELASTPTTGPLACTVSANDQPVAKDTIPSPGQHAVQCATGIGV